MLVNLLNKKRSTEADKKPIHYDWRFLIALPAWVIASYFAAQSMIIAVFWVMNMFGIHVSQLLNKTILEALVAGLVYLLSLALVIGIPYLVRKRSTTLENLGLQRLLTWTDLGLAPLAYIAYALTLALVVAIIVAVIPKFPIDQAQDVGFQSLGRQYEYVFAFVTLVVVGPIAEEALFRGYLYGKLHGHVPVYAAMIGTSLLFAVAHGQWNVAIDTFILSMFLCGLREITGSIWAGVVVHMLKNMIAFFSLFVAPLLMLGS